MKKAEKKEHGILLEAINDKGLPLKKLNYLMAGITIFISAVLLFTIIGTMRGYREMKQTTDNYIDWHQSANDLQMSSDYLTEQARCFAETGYKIYLDSYFEEANVTRRRDKALEHIKSAVSDDSEIYLSLQSAMKESLELMNREYYSMKLTALGFGIDLSTLPDEVRNVKLRDTDAGLSPEEMKDLARTYVFNDEYHAYKQKISNGTQKCLSLLISETEKKQEDAAENLHKLLRNQQILIIILIVIVAAIILLTSFQVIAPLLRAIPHIRSEKPIPLMGSYEFRFLAKTYNQMYEANKKTKKKLVYEAIHDPLTGLYNRNGYEELCKELNIGTSALLIIDVDNFKNINDTYGHDVGDSILCVVSESIRKSFRAVDFACRIGGDEFAVIMIGTSADHIELIQQKIDNINRELDEYMEGKPVTTAVSCGIAFGEDGMHYDELFKKADIALYYVKEHGKKGSAFYTDELAGLIGEHEHEDRD